MSAYLWSILGTYGTNATDDTQNVFEQSGAAVHDAALLLSVFHNFRNFHKSFSAGHEHTLSSAIKPSTKVA